MRGFIFVFALLISASALAQTPAKDIHSRQQAWIAYFNQTRLTKKFGLWMDIHWRQTDHFFERPATLIIRPALTWYINDNVRFNAGYAYVNFFPAKGLHTSRPEHRPWQQVAWTTKYTGLNMIQWLRLEERFLHNIANDALQDGYSLNYRVRYNLGFTVPLRGKEIVAKTPFAVVMNEVFISFGRKVVYNTFDQNRFFVGGGYQFTPQLSAHLGYMNVFQQESSGNRYAISHAIRLYVYHNVNLMKKS